MNSPTLTRQERRCVLVGTILGDASLFRNRFRDGSYQGNALLKITHSAKQREYLAWKLDLIQPMFEYPLEIRDTYNTAAGKRYPVATFQSRVNPQLTRLYKLMYDPETGKKRVTPDILDLLDDRGVATWYMDDGCLNKTQGRGATVIFATNGYTLAENELIRDWIKDRYGVTFNINVQTQTGTFNLRRGISDARKMLDAIAPYVPESMRYKVEYPAPKRRNGWYNLSTTAPGSSLSTAG